jgi:aryl-alcohol dehydrogenase-like predicted oxidoreductase
LKYGTLGTTDISVSSVCLGSMTWGTQNSEHEAHSQLDLATTAGVNFIDTAEMYSVPATAERYGRSETYIGNWLCNKPRDKVIIATKISGPRKALTWIRNGKLRFDEASLRAAVDGSLKRLKTDYIDIYQLHWPDRNTPTFGQYQFDPTRERTSVPITEILTAASALIKEGKIRHLGLANETPWGAMAFLRASEAGNLPRIVTVQNAYNLLNRTLEMGLAEIGYRERVSMLAYSPLAFGLLTGKYHDDVNAPGRFTLMTGFAQRYSKPNVKNAVADYVQLARRYGMSPTAMALGFVANRWFVGSTIVGATTTVQLQEDLAACLTPLGDELLTEIEKIHLKYFYPAP